MNGTAIDFAARVRKGSDKKPPRIVLIGVEGVGKTTAGAQAENPIFLCSEDGLIGNGFEGVANVQPQTWDEILQFVGWLATSKHNYKTLVIDTLDWIEPKLFSAICKRDGKQNVEEYGYGKGYVIALDEFRRLLAGLELLRAKGMMILINTHCQIKNFANPVGDNYDRYELKVSKQIAGLIKEWADAVLFALFETHTYKDSQKAKSKGIGGQKRIVHTGHCAAWDAKNRYGMPETLPLDMGERIAAINKGQPDSAEAIIAELQEISASLPADKKKAAEDYIEANKTNVTNLSKLLNRTRALVEVA
jgi:hypothetical protein